jgi:hypothetical protein
MAKQNSGSPEAAIVEAPRKQANKSQYRKYNVRRDGLQFDGVI